jgi:hypothetical protein
MSHLGILDLWEIKALVILMEISYQTHQIVIVTAIVTVTVRVKIHQIIKFQINCKAQEDKMT